MLKNRMGERMARHDRQVADLIRLSDRRVPSVLLASQRERFSCFLCFEIKDGTGRAPATLLSLFSRMGMEPWDEAQALLNMPEHAATSRLAWLILATTSNYTQPDAELVAEHLLTLLPVKAATGKASRNRALSARRYLIVLISAFVLPWLALVREHPQPPGSERSHGIEPSRHQPDGHRPTDAPQGRQPIK